PEVVIAGTGAAEAVDAPPELPLIDGLDCADGLRRVGGNNNLYVKLPRQVASQQADDAGQILAALATNDVESAPRLAHTLKGVAGPLRAGDIDTHRPARATI